MAVEKRASEAREAREAKESRESPDVCVLTLNHGEHQDATLYRYYDHSETSNRGLLESHSSMYLCYRFEKDTYLHFCPGPSLLGRKVFLYTNYVITDNRKYQFIDCSIEKPRNTLL